VLLLALSSPGLAWGQQIMAGPSVTQIVGSGTGVARTCVQQSHSTGVGARLELPVFRKRAAVQLTGRGYWLHWKPNCVDGFPPPDGTYVQDDRINLLSRSFTTTDVRLATGTGPVSVAVGAGAAWHVGHDLPYLVFATGITILNRPDVQLDINGEFQYLRVTSDRFRRTYQNFELVSQEFLGTFHTGSHALLIGMQLSLPL
jgi:hypothetical protein